MRVRVACALAVASAAALALVASTPALAAAVKRPPNPSPLWRLYPLGTKHLTRKTATRPAPAPYRPPAVISPTSRSSRFPFIGIALGAGAVLVVAAGVAVGRSRLRRGGPTEERFDAPLATIALAAGRLDDRRRARGIEDRAPRWDKWTSESRRKAVSDQLDERVEPVPGAPNSEVEEARQSHADLGDRISGVIRAAEELAEQIRADARQEAADIKRQAEESAEAHMRQVAEEGEELRAQSEAYASDIRRTGENYATERRREAETEAAKLVAEGEDQARAMREAAEQMAQRIETAALQRRDELGERSRVVEARLRRFQVGLVKISTEVEELLEQRGEQSETLDEALEVDQRIPSA